MDDLREGDKISNIVFGMGGIKIYNTCFGGL